MLPLHVEMFLGHDTGLSMKYYRPSEKTLLEDYLKAIDLLTVNYDEAILEKRVSQLQEKSEQDQYVIKGKLSERETEIKQLRQRSEERRVGKECRSRSSRYHYKKKQVNNKR